MKKTIINIWRIVCYPIIYFAFQMLTAFVWSVVIGVYLAADAAFKGREIETEELAREITSALQSQITLIALFSLCLTLLVIWLFMRKEWKRESFWQKVPPAPAALVLCAFLGPPLNMFTSGAIYFTRLTEIFPGYEELISGVLGNNIFLEIITVGVLAPVAEEIIFRGIALKRLRGLNLKLPLALFIQAFLFALIHGNVVQGVYAFVFGIVLGLLYVWFDTVWAPVAAHTAYNSFAVTLSSLTEQSAGAGQDEGVLGFAVLTVVSFIISVGIMVLIRKKYVKRREEI